MCLDFFFFKQKTAYEMRISYWSSDVCSSDLISTPRLRHFAFQLPGRGSKPRHIRQWRWRVIGCRRSARLGSELPSRSADHLDCRVQLRRMDRHATSNAAPRNSWLYLGRATREHV